MEFDKFFRVIHTGIDSYNLYALVVELFFAANDSLNIHEELAANWMKKNNRSYRRLFLEGEGEGRRKN